MHKIKSVILALLISTASAVAADFVVVGNPGNKPAKCGYGSVAYKYEIGQCEVSNELYCEFLNNVAVNGDPHKLYSPLMQDHFLGGIERISTADGYRYLVKTGYGNKAVGGITWQSAARLCNWLHYNSDKIESGEPYTNFRPQTEGTATIGAYDTSKTAVKRNKGAKYFLPTKDEWLKAAFFNGKEWVTDKISSGANIYSTKTGWGCPFPHVKECGKQTEKSHYGTYDQQGNMAEWVEDNDNSRKLALGGSMIRPAKYAEAGHQEGDFPDKSIISFGLRLGRTADSTARKTLSIQPTTSNKADIDRYRPTEYVIIGDAGNQGDIVNQNYGHVNYEFYISRTELSNAQYCQFLNAIASKSDPNGLYDSNMSTSVLGGIDRTKRANGFTYTVKDGFERLPVVYIDYFDIARYCNWLHYGKPTGEQRLGTTEGSAKQGAYDTTDFAAVAKGEKPANDNLCRRNIGAKYWIPNRNEWYKAAYYDPEKLGNRPYHDYPTRSSERPGQDQANYMVDDHLAIPGKYLAPVDSFANAPSYYGTLQQGGNVWEFIEDWQYDGVGTLALRGGSFSYTEYGLNALNEDPAGIGESSHLFGARIAHAVDSNGYQPIADAFTDKLTSDIKQLSNKKLLIIFGLILLLATVGIIFIFSRIYKFICSNISRKSEPKLPSSESSDKSIATIDK
jgi:formylglycine-generating enzyme required for sulfatase activity